MTIQSPAHKNIILIVDDTQTNLDILFEFLKSYNFKVLIAIDGESAIEQIEYIKPDLILLDVMMPGIDGFETCRRLKADPNTKNIPVIFMTALADTVDKIKGFKMGAVDYITKPFQHQELLIRIQTHLTINNLQKQLQQKNDELAHINQNLENLVQQKTKQLIDQEKTAIIGRLIQGMFHNLKSPLQSIQTCSDLVELKGNNFNDDSLIEYSNFINRAINQINLMMENLMIKSSKEQIQEIQPVNINELLKRELQLLEANLHFKHNIKKQYSFDETITKIPVIYSAISQVFHNLINNAIDAMWNKKPQYININTRQNPTHIYIDIEDSGCGISPENLTKIFDPFYTSKPIKGEEKEAGEPTGNGLGLYTCIELLKPFHGEITINSEVGKGSIFTIVLPQNIIC